MNIILDEYGYYGIQINNPSEDCPKDLSVIDGKILVKDLMSIMQQVNPALWACQEKKVLSEDTVQKNDYERNIL